MSTGPVDLSPDHTHIRLTLSKAATMIVLLVGAVGSAVGAFYALKADWKAHTENVYIHLPSDFAQKHGSAVGEWDLVVRDEKTAKGFEALQSQVKALQDARDADRQSAENRKPRWRQ